MPNIKLTISYDGTNYHGWQKQKNMVTIQQTLESALEKILNKKIKLTGAGRTDAGVHAIAQIANFKIASIKIPVNKLPVALNSILPEDIRVLSGEIVDENFHARKSAKSKTYLYVISNTPVQSPFSAKYSWHIPYKINLKRMQKAAKILRGKHDFKSFMSHGSNPKSTVRNLMEVKIKKKDSQIIFTFEADGFLKQMVRNITGTLVEIGIGKREPEEVIKILNAKDRTKAGICAPAHGLFLLKVNY